MGVYDFNGKGGLTGCGRHGHSLVSIQVNPIICFFILFKRWKNVSDYHTKIMVQQNLTRWHFSWKDCHPTPNTICLCFAILNCLYWMSSYHILLLSSSLVTIASWIRQLEI